MRPLQLAILEAASITFAVFAGLLALNGMDGWGWFITAALLSGVSSVKSGPKKERQE